MNDLINAYYEVKIEEYKFEANNVYVLSNLITLGYARANGNKKAKIPSIYETYPSLFKKEHKKQTNKEIKEKLLSYVEVFNKQFEQRGVK